MVTRPTFIRFVVPSRIHPDSDGVAGVVSVAYELKLSADLPLELRAEVKARLQWLEENLPVPSRFNRTRSKGWRHRKARGLSWLRNEASEAVSAMRCLCAAVAACGIHVEEVCETRIGFVVYEDAFQVVAEPFRETRTRASAPRM
jgi:hypothetical protein